MRITFALGFLAGLVLGFWLGLTSVVFAGGI